MAKGAGRDLGAVRVEGLAKFRRDARRAGPEINKQLGAEIKDVAQDVARESSALAPRASGTLAGAYRGTARGTKGIVRNPVFYARFIEFGFHPGGGETAVAGLNPIGRAIERQEDRIVDELGGAVERAAVKLGWR